MGIIGRKVQNSASLRQRVMGLGFARALDFAKGLGGDLGDGVRGLEDF